GRGLDLRRTDPLARDLERVVGAAADVPVAVGVDHGPVAVDPDAGQAAPVGLDVALAILPEAAGHARLRSPDHQLADLAPERSSFGVHDVGRGADARSADTRRVDRGEQVAPHDPAAHLGPARVVDDRESPAADFAEVP